MTALPQWQYGQFGPGGGSLPANVMRTGSIAPYNPLDVRSPLRPQSIEDLVRIPIARTPGIVPTSPPAPLLPPPADDVPVVPTASEAESATMGIVLGSDQGGRPIREFRLVGQGDPKGIAAAFKEVAQVIKRSGLQNASPLLVGGPVAALARGEAIRLRWTNGAVIQAAL
jgi:hypothetical protein